MKCHQSKTLSMCEKYAIICFFDSFYVYDSQWECLYKEIRTTFSHFFDLKLESDVLINWKSIPKIPLITNQIQLKYQNDIERCCSIILDNINFEDLYLFFSFHCSV